MGKNKRVTFHHQIRILECVMLQ